MYRWVPTQPRWNNPPVAVILKRQLERQLERELTRRLERKPECHVVAMDGCQVVLTVPTLCNCHWYDSVRL
jgi:hypothetical protein